MEYRSVAEVEAPRQEMDPYKVLGGPNGWCVIGHCHMTKTVKPFVVSMVQKPVVLDHFFDMPESVDAQKILNRG